MLLIVKIEPARFISNIDGKCKVTGKPIKAAKECEDLKKELVQREAELAIINSIQLALASQLEVQSIYDLVVEKIRDIFDAQIVMISTYDPQTDSIEHRYAIERGERVYAPGKFPIRGFRTQIVKTRQPVLVGTEVAEEAARLGQPTLPGTITPKTWLGVPMLVGDQVTGILSLQNIEQENAFDDSDVRLLQTLAASMSVALENARLWEQEKIYLTALEHEFEVGREIQAGFLPEILPQPKGWEIAASLQPAREVDGDFYDVFDLPVDKIGLVIADVCDKGLGAALFMTLFRSFIRAVSNMDFYSRVVSSDGHSSADRLKKAISLTNNYIAETHGDTGMFATIFFGIFEISTGVLTYINGGNIPPMVINQQGVKEYLSQSGSAVGTASDVEYEIREVTIEPGDTLFAYTDGITDTADKTGTYFSEMDLILSLRSDQNLATLLEQFQNKIALFSAGASRIDDITMLAVKRLK
jgi:sigma-B regulation protein RsbU (phosphoserine phosphatase)